MIGQLVACFTDIEGYSTRESLFGHTRNQGIVNEFLAVGEALIELNHGRCVKGTGDGQLATFDDIESALRFSVELQQYYQTHFCLAREPVRVRIALCLGSAEQVRGDVFGPAVIMAARQASLTEPACVTVNRDLRDQLVRLWSPEVAERSFVSIGEHLLKGRQSAEELYAFQWERHADGKAELTLAARLCDCLESGQIVQANLSVQDLVPPGLVVWPVVPRTIATAIHRGQLEILRLLAFLGWRIHLLVADCGGLAGGEEPDPGAFTEAVLAQASYRGICNIRASRLSSYFDVSYPQHRDVLECFRRITRALRVQELIYINQKEYSENVRQEIRANSTLLFLRPVFTCAAVIHLVSASPDSGSNPKAIVVCGIDEQIQWTSILDLTHPARCLGAIFNPELKISQEGTAHTARQRSDWPIWLSRQQLLEATLQTNVAKWAFQLFVQLPCFPLPWVPSSLGLGNSQRFTAADWTDEFSVPSQINVSSLVSLVWPSLDPARRIHHE